MNAFKMYAATQMLKNYINLIDESKFYNEDLIVAIQILENELEGKDNINLPKFIDKDTKNFIKAIENASVLELISSKDFNGIVHEDDHITFIFKNNNRKTYNKENIICGFGEYWYYEKREKSTDLKFAEYREFYLYLEMMKRTQVLGFGDGEAFLVNTYNLSKEKACEIATLFANYRPEILAELKKQGYFVYKEGM